MSYTLKFEHPHFPPDQEFGINGLGVVNNGGTLEIDEDQERTFVVSQGRSIEDAFGSDDAVARLSGSSALSADELKSLLPVAEEQNNESTSPVPTSNTPTSAASSPPVNDENEGGEN